MQEVLLVGNPNSGKTTLFNSLAKANEHVGNWHGVTVDNKQKVFDCNGQEYLLVDTPGIYSLKALSFEEEVAIKTILDKPESIIINLCDQNNLQRNLYLTLCLLENNCNVIVVINQIDKRPIYKLDCNKLSKKLGVDVLSINAEKNIGLDGLKKCLKNVQNGQKLPYFKQLTGNEIEDSQLRYDFIEKLLNDCAVRTKDIYGYSKFDKVLLNKWLAFPFFLLLMSCVFYLTFFSIGSFLSELLTGFLGIITSPILGFLANVLGQGIIYDLFENAIFGGLSTVLSFLPQVVLLFFFLSVLEDSGYLSRIAFIFEDILSKVGLSGKSVYTLLMGFGCSTTAIMTSRNMEDKNAKIKTALLCPYMSCSAKIPIYTVIGGAFFGAKNIFCIVGLYLLGVVVAIVVSKILEKTVLKSKEQGFILEFPPYRRTSLKRVGKILWSNVKAFLFKVGSVMLSMNVLIWILSSFSFKFSYVSATGGVSMLETIGRLLSPIFSPLGFGNWAVVSALLAGLVAKEVVVSSIAMFNGVDASANTLLSESVLLSTSAVFFATKASVMSFLVFCLLYTPCVASISMLLHEIGAKWTTISIVVQLFVAYVLSFFIYNFAFAIEIFGFFKPFFVLVGFFVVIFSVFCVVKKFKKKKCFECNGCSKNCKYKK